MLKRKAVFTTLIILVLSVALIWAINIYAASAYTQIEAESFSSQSGVQTETCSDTGGGQNVGYIANGDYTVYSNIDFGSGAASFSARVASANSGGNIEIRLDSLTGTLVGTCAISGTGGWQTWVTQTCSISGASGVHTLYLKFTGGSGDLFNFNWFKFTASGNTSAYNQIEAESYSSQLGIQNETCSDTGGGQDVGWIQNGDYTAYTNIDFGSGATGFNARVSSATSGGNIEIRLDSITGTLVGTCVVTGTGGWQTWVTQTCNVSGASGVHNLYLKFTGGSGDLMNINWFKFVTGGSTPTATPTPVSTPTPTPTPSGSSAVWYQNFESGTGFSGGTNATVALSSGNANSGGNCVKLTFSVTGDPGTTAQCVNVTPQSGSSINASSYNYLIFFVNDTQGANTIRVTITDTSNASWNAWTSAQSVKNVWTKISVPLSSVTGINKAAIKQINIGEWNAGTYYFDDIYFAMNSTDGLPGGGSPTPSPGVTPTATTTPTATRTSTPTQGVAPDFGPNVHIFDTSMGMSAIQSTITSVYNAQQNNQFGSRRDALVFKPGTYNVDVGVGFYTEVLGLGANPDAVHITGNLHSDSYLSGNNSTCNFWRGATNFSVTPNNGQVKWAVSQAIWFRQMHIKGNIALHQNGGWASGGWMSNTLVDGTVDSGPQQQWISRNTQWGSWTGSNWNMVFVGVVNAPAGNWPSPPYTKVATVPIVREKPFLQIDGNGNYSVRVPSLKTNSSGYDWAGGSVPGTTIPIDQFYIAKAGTDTAATINNQLAAGKNLILTPGIYGLNDTIRVTRANTIILGMGLATLQPTTGLAAMTVADVDGVTISGVLFDAGTTNSPVLLEVGTNGNTTSHASNPIVLHDVIFRVGGAAAGKATVSFRINAYDTIVDHTWVWRADHGTGVGWTSNTATNGLVVNGNNVTIYGLFVEHYQQYQTLWNGNGGRVYFYQSEIPYDPPNQSSWTSGSGVNGWASYKVADSVTSHEAWGLGIYSVFTNGGIYLTRAIEVPNNANVKFHDMITVCIGANGGISNVINNTGGATQPNCSYNPKVTNFP